MNERASETDESKQIYGPETCQKVDVRWDGDGKIKVMYSNYQSMMDSLKSVSATCASFVEEANKEKQEEEEKKQRELAIQKEEEERLRREEEERKRQEELREEEERKRREEEERLRKQQEEEERQRRIAEAKAREEERKRLEAEEEERQRQAAIARQKAIIESFRKQREAEQAAAAAKKAAEEEAARKAAEEAAAAAEAAWQQALSSDLPALETTDLRLETPLPSVEGVSVEPSGLWTLKTAAALETALHCEEARFLCVFWFNPYSEKSKESQRRLSESISSHSSLRILSVNTSLFPQLSFKYNGQISCLPCFENGTQTNASTADTVLETLDAFERLTLSKRRRHFLQLLQDAPSPQTDAGRQAAVEAELFGQMGVTEPMRAETEHVLQRLREATGEGPAFLQAVRVWCLLVRNVLQNPQDPKFARVRCGNEKLRAKLLGW